MNEDSARLMQFVLEMRQQGVTEARALAALERTPRPHYAPGYLSAMAWEDTDLPIAHNQTMTKPSTIGRMITALNPQKDDVVLEVGTGSGYQAGAISTLCRKVVTLDRWRALIAIARAHFGSARIMHIYAYTADGAEGLADAAPYDRIIINACVEKIPEKLSQQLKPGGVIVAPMLIEGKQMLTRWTGGARENLGPIQFAPLAQGLPDNPRPVPEEPRGAP